MLPANQEPFRPANASEKLGQVEYRTLDKPEVSLGKQEGAKGWDMSGIRERVEENVKGGERRLWMFSAEVQHLRGMPVVEAAGEIDLASLPELSEAVERAVAELEGSPSPLLVLDLSRVSFMECRGLSFLVGQQKKLQEYGGLRLVLSSRGAARRLIELAGLEEEFAVYADAESAVGAPRR